MTAISELHRLDATEYISAEELCRACGISIDELREVVAYGVAAGARDEEIRADWLMPLREALRLRRDFDLDLFAAGLLAEHLHRIDLLEREIRALRARLAP